MISMLTANSEEVPFPRSYVDRGDLNHHLLGKKTNQTPVALWMLLNYNSLSFLSPAMQAVAVGSCRPTAYEGMPHPSLI